MLAFTVNRAGLHHHTASVLALAAHTRVQCNCTVRLTDAFSVAFLLQALKAVGASMARAPVDRAKSHAKSLQ